MAKKNLCIIQARTGSTRLPNKVLLKVKGLTLLEYEIRRIKMAKKVDKIVVATTMKEADDKIENLCKRMEISCFRGSEEDVLDRYWQCVQKYSEYENIIRITSDCPLVDPRVIDETISFFEKNRFDYVANSLQATFPDGMDTEIFTRKSLEQAHKNAKLISEREHVTLWMRENRKFRKGNFSAEHNWEHFRLTVDNKEDFEVVKFLIENSPITAGYLDYISLLTKNPAIMLKNAHIARNEGLLKALRSGCAIK